MPPETRLTVQGATVHLVGTVQGFVPDAARVREAIRSGPDVVALGIPPEDLPALEALHRDPALAEELPEPDEWSARLLELLSPFGATRIPSPDLEAAFATALEQEIPVVTLDLDDVTHTDAHTSRLKIRHIVVMNRRRNKLLKTRLEADDPYALAAAWDAQEHAGGPLRAVQEQREEHMARRLRGLADAHRRIVAVVPAPRFDGIVRHLHRPRHPPQPRP